jgi:hypothetical protein
VADRVHTTVQAMKAAGRQPPVDAGIREAARQQLRRVQDPMVALG